MIGVLTQPVEFALRTLGEEDRRTVTAWLDHLKDWETDEFVRGRSQRLKASDDVYVLKAGTEFRVFFRLGKDGITVEDIAQKDALKSFGRVAEPGHS